MNNSILLLDPSFDPHTAKNCTLLVNIGLDHISYAIIRNDDNFVHVVFDEQECESPVQQFSQRVKTDAYLHLPFLHVKIGAYTDNLIHIPNDLYRESNLSDQAQFFAGLPGPHVYQHQHEKFDLTTIFSLPKALDTLLAEHFPDASLSTFVQLDTGGDGNTLQLNFSAGSFSAVYTENHQLIFEKVYEISTVEEFNYYLLLIINQLSINTSSTLVNLSGIVHQDDERFQCIAKYFPKVSFAKLDQRIKQEILEDMPAHYYVNLLAHYTCE